MDRRHFLKMSLSAAAVSAAVAACGDDAQDSSVGADPSSAATSPTQPAPTPSSTVSGSDPGGGSAPAPAPSTVAGLVVPEPLMFTAPLVGGGSFDGTAYAGTPLALWFWSPT